MQINLNHLYYFKDLAQTLSFTDTARNLNIAQPAVSRAIKNLEEQLEMELFLRNKKQVFLSPEGKELYEKLQGPLSEILNFLDQAQDETGAIRGHLKIGSLFELGEFKVLPLVTEFMKKFPEVTIDLVYGGNKELEEKLKIGELDFLFGIGEINQENIQTYKILKQSSYLLTSNKSNPFKNKFEDNDFILYRHNDPLLEEFLKKFYPKHSMGRIKKKAILNSHKAMVNILKNFPDTFATLPELSEDVFKAIEKGHLVQASNKKLQTSIYFSLWNQNFMPERNLEFKRFCLDFWK